MKLNDFFAGQPHGSKAKMAKALKISKTWLSLIIAEKEMPSPVLAVAISNYTNNKVKRQVLRPDIFGV